MSTRGLSTAIAMMAGLLAMSAPASAAPPTAQSEIGQVTVECGDHQGGLISVEMLNPSGVPVSFMVGAEGTRTDYAESMVINLPDETVAEFAGVPNDRFHIVVWDDTGAVFDEAWVRVKCRPAL
jgi:hypothetical protein